MVQPYFHHFYKEIPMRAAIYYLFALSTLTVYGGQV